MKVLTSFVSVACLLLASLASGFGHGSMADPISRSYEVFLEGPQNPKTDAAKAAIAVAGTQAFYDWHEVNRQLPNHDYRTQILDGKLPGAGRDKYAGLNLARTDWPATKVSPGHYHCVFYAATPHDPSYFEAYITKPGYDPTKPLKWSDLEALPGGEGAVLKGKNYEFDVHFPERTGRHVLYVIWQRIDPVGEVFFSTSDLDFGGVDYGTPSPTPETAPDLPDDHDHDHGTPTPTPAPTPTPTPSPGAGNARFENETVIVNFKITNDWISGFQGDVVIENKTAVLLKDWKLSFRFDRDISGPWNARVASKSGDLYTFDAQPYLWNKDI
ncbi:MAG TPA: lytic polysaccharide monooxygenase, partial [Terrimicrobiaceae bacterium]|nr:lytic polysaccharide monooxygenase [Terrimicrobiaceae bacterium]